MTESNPNSFLLLDDMHSELDELFESHQEHLIGLELAAAAASLDTFLDRLRLHIYLEEEWLLPIYAARGERREYSTRPKSDIYLLEHAKLLQLLGNSRAEVGALALAGSCSRRQIIAALDRETTIKRIMEHHGERERTVLYPELDRQTSPDERRQLIERCFSGWRDQTQHSGTTVGNGLS